MTQQQCEREYDFTLVLEPCELTTEFEDAMLRAADDATLAFRSGRPFLTFSRSAGSLKDAIISAIDDVRSAGARVVRIDECNLITQAEIARRIGRSRQMVHQFIVGSRGPGGFPSPACEISNGAPLWYWCEVAHWLWENNMIKEDVLREITEIDILNCVLELERQKKLHPELTREVFDAVMEETKKDELQQ